MIKFLSQPWPWYVAGPIITLNMFLLLYFGRQFGVSSTLRTMCAIGGAGKVASFFKFNWRDQLWNIVFVIGGLLGGVIASQFLQNPKPIQLNKSTVAELTDLGIEDAGKDYLPESLFSWDSFSTVKGFTMLVLGGFLVGFGTRYAGGCTSGHAISGLSNLQLPSLTAVVGFFIGGLLSVHFLLPLFV
ncbi:MAG: YeeE/YedE thiosulfate transporter family protein [Bacteroidota bacterium]